MALLLIGGVGLGDGGGPGFAGGVGPGLMVVLVLDFAGGVGPGLLALVLDLLLTLVWILLVVLVLDLVGVCLGVLFCHHFFLLTHKSISSRISAYCIPLFLLT